MFRGMQLSPIMVSDWLGCWLPDQPMACLGPIKSPYIGLLLPGNPRSKWPFEHVRGSRTALKLDHG
eukprot:scaffold107269_cov38-Prasinocladus_malaysianus.AAC.1